MGGNPVVPGRGRDSGVALSQQRDFSLGGRDVTLAATAWGDEQSPLVVLLHGGGQTRHAWGETGRALGHAGFRAVSVDLRGHGDSGWAPDGDYARSAFVDDLAAVAEQLGTHAAFVGASLGGLTSLLAVGERRVSAWALVLVDVVPRVEREGAQRVVSFMRSRPDGFASLEEAADSVAEYLPHRRRPADLDGLQKNLRLAADGRWRWHWDPRFAEPDVLSGALSDASRQRVVAAAGDVRIPTLVVRGMLSDVVAPEGIAEFRGLVPHAEVCDVAGAGHMVAGDRNHQFTGAVADFLSRVAFGESKEHPHAGTPATPGLVGPNTRVFS